MSNLPIGSSSLPGVTVQTISAGGSASVPGGIRRACVVGLSQKSEIIVATATGGGKDGLNSTYTTVTGRDSRHFLLKNAPIVSNRTQLFKNGIPLVGLEEAPDSSTFDNRYDYRIDIATGRIELQTAYLIDQGGLLYSIGGTNVGEGDLDGYSGPELLDLNAPTETWTIKCISVQRNSMGAPIQETAKFIAFGSVSGVQLDASGSPIIWLSNGQEVGNGIIKFAISETQSSNISLSPFREGDFFTIRVKSGALNKNDTLTATYIAVADLNDPEFFTSMEELTAKHGSVTTANTLPLGASLAFANSTPGVFALQAKPSLPRRSSYVLIDSFDATSTDSNDFVVPLPLGVIPDFDSNIHVFVTDPTTKVETQLLPNKYDFYTLDTGGNPSTHSFVFSDTNAPAGWSFSYSVNQSLEVLNFGNDGYINRSLTSQALATFSVDGTIFTADYVGKQVKVFDATNKANNGIWDVTSVSGSNLTIAADLSPPFPVFVNDTSVTFNVINPVTGLVVASSSGTDGALVAVPSSASHATFSSSAVNFTGLSTLTGLQLHIVSSLTVSNEGLFDILSVDGSDVLTIAKSFVSENNLHYEVIDPDNQSDYLVLNHNIVPDGNSLRVTVVDTRDADFFDAGWVEVLEKLETLDVDMLVPLPTQTMSVIFQNFANHCITMSNLKNKLERVLLTGAIRGLTPDNLTGLELAAVEDIGILEGIQGDSVAEILAGNTEDLSNYSVSDAFGTTYRVQYFYPDEIVVEVNGENTIVDGFFLGAAAAGFYSANADIRQPLTNKALSGFSILRNKTLSVTVMEALSAAGVAVVQPITGGGRVIWGQSTTQSGFPEEQEMSIVFIRDRVAKNLRAGFAGYIGIPEDSDTLAVLTTRAKSLLTSFVGSGIITDFTNLTVHRDAVDPRQFDISVLVSPSYPINFIFIRVSFGII